MISPSKNSVAQVSTAELPSIYLTYSPYDSLTLLRLRTSAAHTRSRCNFHPIFCCCITAPLPLVTSVAWQREASENLTMQLWVVASLFTSYLMNEMCLLPSVTCSCCYTRSLHLSHWLMLVPRPFLATSSAVFCVVSSYTRSFSLNYWLYCFVVTLTIFSYLLRSVLRSHLLFTYTSSCKLIFVFIKQLLFR